MPGWSAAFQRTPDWCAPLHNGSISKAEMRDIRAHYRDIFARRTETPGCYIHAPDPRATHAVTAEEREAFWIDHVLALGQGSIRITVTIYKIAPRRYEHLVNQWKEAQHGPDRAHCRAGLASPCHPAR
jgi:hypothetical protein